MIMLDRFSGSTITVAIAVTAVGAVMSASITTTSAQTPAVKTSWGEPDLQGIWTDEFDTPLQRPAKYATQEFFTEAQRAELDQSRAAVPGRLSAPRRGKGGPQSAAVLFPQRNGAAPAQNLHPPPRPGSAPVPAGPQNTAGRT